MSAILSRAPCVNTWRPNNGILELGEHWSIKCSVKNLEKYLQRFTSDKHAKTSDIIIKLDLYFLYWLRTQYGCIQSLNQCHAASLSIAVYTFYAGVVWHQLLLVDTNVNKVQICWIFKTSTYQHWHSSQSEKFSKVTQSQHVVLHEDVYGCLSSLRLPRAYMLFCMRTYMDV